MLTRRVPHSQWVAITIVATLVLTTLVLRTLLSSRSSSKAPAIAPVIVAVEGDVRHPGNYLFEAAPVTISDALTAAGGTTGEAHLPEAVQSQELQTGQSLVIRAQGEATFRIGPMPAAARLALGEKLDLNTASEADLSLIPQMKPDQAAAIVARRSAKSWKRLSELEEIPGIGPKTIEKWQEYLTVGN